MASHGSWAKGRIEFTVNRDGSETTYVALFHVDNPDSLAFIADSDTLILINP